SVYLSFISPPPIEFGAAAPPDVYRILYVHVPPAWISYLSMGFSLVSSIVYLARRSVKADAIALSSMRIGLPLSWVAIVTGSLWANITWGEYWSWDPRETTTLILALAFTGYFALRWSIPDIERKRRVSAMYAIASFITVPLSYYSAILWRTLHPIVITHGEIALAPHTGLILMINLATALLIFLTLLYLSYKVEIAGGKQ
ncbi:MAG: cytochrome c biogenesis protein CcsA, partial [Candidatus Methanomethylicia archaeon]